MGIFAYHIGKMDIPEEHREEWARQMLTVLRAGGMMTINELRLYRKKIYLLSPPEPDEEGRATGYYNYFEKECWEDWWLNVKRGNSQGVFSFGREYPLREPQRNTRAFHRCGKGRLARIRSQFSRRFLESASLHPPPAALRCFPLDLPLTTLRLPNCTRCSKKCLPSFVSIRFDSFLAPLGRSCGACRSQNAGRFLEMNNIQIFDLPDF